MSYKQQRGGRRGGGYGGGGGGAGTGHSRQVLVGGGRGGGGGTRQPRTQGRAFQVARLEDVGPKVVIEGLPATVDPKDVMDYLRSRTVKPGMVFKGHEFRNRKLYLTLEKNDDAQTLANLSNFRYGGDQVTIARETQAPIGGRVERRQTQDIKGGGKGIKPGTNQYQYVQKFEQHLQKEYKDDSPLLNLSYLSATLSINFNESATLRPLYKLISEKCPKVYRLTTT
ncbi:hypothetical protein SAMD00019534_044810 [Acytostelium subglobosum LB1]|uniref:hypothetical protein n=1 Tax=Acytostelium subglobosum LB1 TaxID=1410327 RepID=UPI000644DF88|nr:hypothetical protein SAMD00019534_044810 [Acytostelium subglobosum LB1]GAM21306.1 hypothetical protein SAMD00019534_044810 [Acytostelium subglobosum LB1]|eukprot:XP_012755425.1 hypothetical protein SAMD00019534_044810 [Acytostelium subglobosum LB1]